MKHENKIDFEWKWKELEMKKNMIMKIKLSLQEIKRPEDEIDMKFERKINWKNRRWNRYAG